MPARDAERILRTLPEWFGIESALMDYVRGAQSSPNFLAREESETVGFVTLREHNPVSLELHCIAVLPDRHRSGIGRRLCAAAERWWAARGGRLVQVKTLGPARASEHYARTRAFYDTQGYLPVEEFADLWPGNPCLLLVKPLRLPDANGPAQ
jgi:GNAT superfamily N-acetyltransferase